MDYLDYCSDKSATAGYCWQYIRLYIPRERRPALDIALTFRRELAELIERQLDPEIIRLRLHWWRNEIGQNRTTPSQHPLLQAIGTFQLETSITVERMLSMVNATETTLNLSVISDEAQLLNHAMNETGVIYEMLAAICAGDETATRAAAHLGIAEHLLTLRQPYSARYGFMPDSAHRARLALEQVNAFHVLQPENEYRMLPAVWVAAKLLAADAESETFDPQQSPLKANWIAWRAAQHAARMKRNNEKF